MRMSPGRPAWSFISSHGHVLIEVARNPDATVREIADGATLTERQAHRVLADLVGAGYVARERVGRRNRYRIDHGQPMRAAKLNSHCVGELLEALAD
jgi:DNA-binding IclR family transcriptional regulator